MRNSDGGDPYFYNQKRCHDIPIALIRWEWSQVEDCISVVVVVLKVQLLRFELKKKSSLIKK